MIYGLQFLKYSHFTLDQSSSISNLFLKLLYINSPLMKLLEKLFCQCRDSGRIATDKKTYRLTYQKLK